MGVLQGNMFRGLMAAVMIVVVATVALSSLGCGAQSNVKPGQYYLVYHVVIDVDEPRLYAEGDVKVYVVVKEPGIAYLANITYSNVKVHEAAESVSESKVSALLVTIMVDFIDIWRYPDEIPENGVVSDTAGYFGTKSTYDKPTGFLTRAEFIGSSGHKDIEVNLVDTNVPGLTPVGGGGLGFLPLLAGIGIAVAAVAVVAFIVRSRKLRKPHSTYAPLPPPPPPPG